MDMEAITGETEKAIVEIELENRGWVQKHGMLTHEKRVYRGLPYMFTFEQARKAENL